nr:retrotransposon protein, putative, unclassified [Tanacetum cinerariifolium]
MDANLVVTKSIGVESENNSSRNALNKSVNETQMQKGNVGMGKALDVGLVVTESSGTKSDKHDTNSRSGNYITHVVDADIIPVNDQEPFAEVQLTAQHNVLANEHQHTEQSKPTYDTYLLEKMFDEYFNPPPSVASTVPAVVAPNHVHSTGTPSSTTIDQDAPSQNYKDALKESFWIEAMQEELNEFERLEVWELVPHPDNHFEVDLQEAIRIFIAYATYMNMVVYQIDVKTTFLNDIIREEVYAPRTWYDLLSSFLLSQKFSKGTVDPTLFTQKEGKDILLDSCIALIAFANADHAGCQDTRRSTSRNYGLGFNKIPLYCDNKSAIALCCNNVQHSRSKHIDIGYHFIKVQVENRELYFVRTKYQLPDIFTKALERERLEFLINKLGMRSMSPETLKRLAEEEDQNQRDLPRDIPLDRIEVLRYDTKGVKVRKGIMQTKTELTVEQTQQGVSDEVLLVQGIVHQCLQREDMHNGDHVPAVPTTKNSPVVPEHTTIETLENMSPENKAHYKSKKEAIHLILTGIGQEIYLTRCMQNSSGNVASYQKVTTRFMTIIKQQHKLDEVSYHKLFDILKQYQKEVNQLHAERIARNSNQLALVATTQSNQDPYYQTPKSHKPYAPTSKASIPTRAHATTRNKGKKIAKPIIPPSESASEEDSDPEQAQRDKDMQKNLALIAKYFKKIYKPTNNNLITSSNSRNKNVDTTQRYRNDNQSTQFGNQRTMIVAGARENVGSPIVQQTGIQCFNCKEFGHYVKECRKPKRVKDSMYHKEKMLLCKQAEQGVPLQAEKSDWRADTDEEIDEQELEAHYSYMEKI